MITTELPNSSVICFSLCLYLFVVHFAIGLLKKARATNDFHFKGEQKQTLKQFSILLSLVLTYKQDTMVTFVNNSEAST